MRKLVFVLLLLLIEFSFCQEIKLSHDDKKTWGVLKELIDKPIGGAICELAEKGIYYKRIGVSTGTDHHSLGAYLILNEFTLKLMISNKHEDIFKEKVKENFWKDFIKLKDILDYDIEEIVIRKVYQTENGDLNEYIKYINKNSKFD